MKAELPEPSATTVPAKQPDQSLPGIVILGGAHGALALARSFGRQDIPVIFVIGDHPLPTFSTYVQESLTWPGTTSADACRWLLDLARTHDLKNWLIVPCGDNEVTFVAENREFLRTEFRVISCDWPVLRQLCNKQLLAAAAANIGLACPANYSVRSIKDAESTDINFPVILKPAVRIERNAFTSAKAWRANSRAEFIDLYRDASSLVGFQDVVVQEFIPGGGKAQFSYAALWYAGSPIAEMTACRLRQYPIEFGYTSTFVEVVENSTVRTLATNLLASIGFEGFVEVEFKFDARDGSYKILDVNPRPWSWFGLCEAAGLDFPGLIEKAIAGQHPQTAHARPGYAWIHTVRDMVALTQLLMRGGFGWREYIAALSQKLTFAAFALDDPLPGLLEFPSTLYRLLVRQFPRSAALSRPVKQFFRIS